MVLQRAKIFTFLIAIFLTNIILKQHQVLAFEFINFELPYQHIDSTLYSIFVPQERNTSQRNLNKREEERYISLNLGLGLGNMYSGVVGLQTGVSLKVGKVFFEPFIAYGIAFVSEDVKLPYPNILGQTTETVFGTANEPGAGVKLLFPITMGEDGDEEIKHLVFIAPVYGLSGAEVFYKITCTEEFYGRTCKVDEIGERGINGISLIAGYSAVWKMLYTELGVGINWARKLGVNFAFSIGTGIKIWVY